MNEALSQLNPEGERMPMLMNLTVSSAALASYDWFNTL